MSVLSPKSAPSRLTIVLTAPARRAAGDTSSTSAITAILCGTVTLAPRLPGRAGTQSRSRGRPPACASVHRPPGCQADPAPVGAMPARENARRDRRSRPAGRDHRMGRGRTLPIAYPPLFRKCSTFAACSSGGDGEGVFTGIALGDEVHVRRVVREEHRLDRGESRVRNRTRWQPVLLIGVVRADRERCSSVRCVGHHSPVCRARTAPSDRRRVATPAPSG